MLSGIKIYKIKDFIRKTETGNIDFERSKKIVKYESAIEWLSQTKDIGQTTT
jgi:hypothetical protein